MSQSRRTVVSPIVIIILLAFSAFIFVGDMLFPPKSKQEYTYEACEACGGGRARVDGLIRGPLEADKVE